MSRFKKAVRERLKLRMALDGPSGAGKSFTALRFAFALAGPGGRVVAIDTEHESLSKYVGLAPDEVPFDFDVCNLTKYAPTEYTAAINEASAEGPDVLVIDSLSHAWVGEGGALELKDKQGGNSFTAWKDITPMHNKMVEAILKSRCHVIVTMRSKTEYVMEPDERGKQVPRKVGLAPVQRAGMEYEFDIYASLDHAHVLRVTKSRCPEVADLVVPAPGASFMTPVIQWLNTGVEVADKFLPASPEAKAKLLALALDKKKLGPEAVEANLKKKYGVGLDKITAAQADEVIQNLSK